MSHESASSLIISGRVSTAPACLANIANRAYRIHPGGRATPLSESVPVLLEPVHTASSNPGRRRSAWSRKPTPDRDGQGRSPTPLVLASARSTRVGQ